MQHAQLMALVQIFAATHHAYVSVDVSDVFVFENGKIHFQPSKLAISPVPYTEGAYYVRIKDLYFPAAFTPSQLKKNMLIAWNLACEPSASYLKADFLRSELCK
jgi:hypothetical protein